MFMILSLSLINGFSSAVCHSVAVSSFSIFPRPQISEFLCSWVLLLLCVSANEVKPDFYYLEDQDKEDDVCLATSFTRHNAVTSQQDFKGFNETKPTMITEFGGVYNQVFSPLRSEGVSKVVSLGRHLISILLLFADPIVNLASLTILGLRVIFFKTVVFNVLMTLRLWSRQCEYQKKKRSPMQPIQK
uniref:Uncharacterized protein n=1 Tax=Oryzias latipes TaxID=8090 RepID=A0A3B3I9J5_ORYLA